MIEKFESYVTYLNYWINSQAKQGFGIRKKIADYLGVQTSYISQVLSKTVVLKEEYAWELNEFLRHDPLESDYFVTLVAIERASSHALKVYHQNKAQEIKNQLVNLVTPNDGSVKFLDQETQYEEFFSSWFYVAARALSAIKEIDAEVLENQFSISKSLARNIVSYLSGLDLILQEGNKYRHSGKGLHLPKAHKWVNHHHANWRIKTLEVLQRGQPDDLHYTSVATLSAREAQIIKESMRALIRDIRTEISKAADEEVYCYSLDFFSVVKPKI